MQTFSSQTNNLGQNDTPRKETILTGAVDGRDGPIVVVRTEFANLKGKKNLFS